MIACPPARARGRIAQAHRIVFTDWNALVRQGGSVAAGTMPPYARIAAELRRQIEHGELAPGERVPSTREIIVTWGVAMATATKALSTLRNEGLVHPVPGVGTVVAGRIRPAGGRRSFPADTRRLASDPGPASDRIIATAIEVADAGGLAGLSMRRVAAEMGVATMSLYRHVADKDDLVLRMIDAVFGRFPLPADPPDDWRPRLEIAARMLWSMFRRHQWLAPAMSVTRPQPAPAAVPYTEWVLTALDGHGLSLPVMLTTHITLFNYVRGTAVNLELEAEAEAASGLTSEEWMDSQQGALRSIMETDRFPLLARLAAEGYDFDINELFEFGLQRLLDGLAVMLRATGIS
jgi:AcrR family transcriptional regulator